VPRFSATLRHSDLPTVTSGTSVDQLHIERNQCRGASNSRDPAAGHLLGEASTAPRAAKDPYSSFAQLVSDIVPVTVAGDDLAQLLSAAYTAISRPPSERMQCLQQALGAPVSAADFKALDQAHDRLREARASLRLPEVLLNGRPAPARPWHPPPGTSYACLLLSPRSAVVRLCDPYGRLNQAQQAGQTDTAVSAVSSSGATMRFSGERAASVKQRDFNPDPDSDDEAMGVRRNQATLTWLECTICEVTGLSPPSKGGDDSVLLLVLRALAGPASGDAVAGEILEMLGFDHIDVAARIVNARVVRIPHELLSLQHVLMCPVRCVDNRSVRFQRQSRVQTCSLASLQGVLDSLKKAVEMMRAADAANTGEDKSNVSVTVKLSTASQKAIEKMERKAARKAKSKGSGGRVCL
jgi:hypothetical protein